MSKPEYHPQVRRARGITGRAAALLLSLGFAAACEQSPLEPDAQAFTPLRSVEAAAFDGTIRIGVVPAAAAIQLGATGGWELIEKPTGEVVQTGSGGTMQVSLESPAQTVTIYRLQVVCTSAANAETRVAAITAAGFVAETEVAPAGCTRVLIVKDTPGGSWSSRVEFLNRMIALGLAEPGAFWNNRTELSAAVLRVVGASTELVDGAVILRPTSGNVTIKGVHYRGVAEVAPNSSGSLAGINHLPMEEYLYGVVPRELGPIAYPELEALKAQAVAARTYAMRGLGKRKADGYDLLATTTDQVYGGLGAEHPLSSQAVDETAGIVAKYDGLLIEALYSSTTGGFSADNEEVYNSAPVAYLRGVPDANRGEAFEHVPTLEVFKNHANPRSLRNWKDSDYEADWSRYHRWTIDWTAAEISQVISAYAGQDVGAVHAINVLERGPSGRVLRIEYVTDAGSFYDTKDRIRSSLKFFNTSGAMSSLLSTLFYIEPVADKKTGAVTGFVAYGGGWGHGVGMSQTGAVGMATKKATYDEILKHYYRDITLEPAY